MFALRTSASLQGNLPKNKNVMRQNQEAINSGQNENDEPVFSKWLVWWGGYAWILFKASDNNLIVQELSTNRKILDDPRTHIDQSLNSENSSVAWIAAWPYFFMQYYGIDFIT